MSLEHAFSRFGFQDQRSYGKREVVAGLHRRLRKYRKGGKAYSVIRSYFFWLDIMSRQDTKAWLRRASQIRAMIIDCHGGPGNYIRNDDKSGMIAVIFDEMDREEARLRVSRKRKLPDSSRTVFFKRKRY